MSVLKNFQLGLKKIPALPVLVCLLSGFAAPQTLLAIQTPADPSVVDVSSSSFHVYVGAHFTDIGEGQAAVALAVNGSYGPWFYDNTMSVETFANVIKTGSAVASANGRLYFFGGCYEEMTYMEDPFIGPIPIGMQRVQLGTVLEYIPETGAWEQLANAMPTPRCHAAAATVDGKIYVIGGENSTNPAAVNPVATVEEFNPQTGTWASKAGMPTARYAAAAAAAGGKIYAVGGATSGSAVTAVNEEYDPAANTWASRSPLPSPRMYIGLAEAGDKLYAVGGAATHSGSGLADNLEYSPAEDAWTAKSNMLTARRGLAAVSANGKVYAVGGEASTQNQEYDPATDSWMFRTPLPITGSLWTLGALAGGRIYLNNNNPSELVIYTPYSGSGYITGLTPNTQYTLKAKARDTEGVETAEGPSVSRYTLAATPTAAEQSFSNVGETSLTAYWADDVNPAGTLYWAQVYLDGNNVIASSATYNKSASFEGLDPSPPPLESPRRPNRVESPGGSPYHVRVAAVNGDIEASDYLDLGQAVTMPPPDQAGTPSGVALGVSSVGWTWAAMAEVDGYNIYPATATSAVIGSEVSTAFIWEGLSPNTTYSIVVAAVNAGGPGQRSDAAAQVWTLANPPSGMAAPYVYASSLTVSWGLNGNGLPITAKLERSTDNVTFAQVYSGALQSYDDTGLLGCSTYYYRARNMGGAAEYSAYSAAAQFVTQGSTPAAPGGLYAEPLEGNKIALSWEPALSEGTAAYRLYYDNGTGTIDYGTPLAVLASTDTAYTTAALAAGTAYKFNLRAVNRCGIEEANTTVLASAETLASLSGVRAGIKIPQTGKRVDGDRVTVMAELTLGDEFQTREVKFQYKAAADLAWTDITAAGPNHPNPDAAFPYMLHWDVSGLAPGDYNLRAVARDAGGVDDAAPSAVTVTVDPVDPDISETDLGGGAIKKEQKISNYAANILQAAAEGAAQAARLEIPAGALSASTVTVAVTNSPALAPAAPANVQAAGVVAEVSLSNGQTQLSGGLTAAVALVFPDENGDGIVDGTTVRADTLLMYSAETLAGPWVRDFGSTVDLANRRVTGNTPHFSFFALFSPAAANLDGVRVYPVPFKPNDADADNGVPYAASNGNSGIVFDQLPASVKIKIYTLTGQLVAEFGSGASSGKLQWDARNDDGREAASGGYLAVISSPGGGTVVKKLLVVR